MARNEQRDAKLRIIGNIPKYCTLCDETVGGVVQVPRSVSINTSLPESSQKHPTLQRAVGQWLLPSASR